MAHVDAQLEGAGGHHAAQSAALERLLDEGALFFGDGAVVRAGQRRHSLGGVHISLCGVLLGVDAAAGELSVQVNVVERGGELFGESAGVHEDDCRTVVLDMVDDAFLHAGPDGGLGASLRPACGLRVGFGGVKNGVEVKGSLGTDRGCGGKDPDGVLEGVAGGREALCGRLGRRLGGG